MDHRSPLIPKSSPHTPAPHKSLRTFGGVFAPVTLGMFSSVIFLRIGYTVGNLGISYSILQVIISAVIVIVTVLSICAISTNGEIHGGGTYYVVSRTLGPEFGGVIGLLLYLGQIVSTSLYVVSAVEVLLGNYAKYLIQGDHIGRWDVYLYATFVAGFCLIISLIGGKLFSRITNVILLIVVICISSVVVSFAFESPKQVLIPRSNIYVYPSTRDEDVHSNFTGLSLGTCINNLKPSYSLDYTVLSARTMTSFGIIFAVFFTGMTGITNGVNLSGELVDPSFSIPVGTLSSSLSVTLLYILLVVLTGCSCDRFLLQNDYNYMKDINLVPDLVVVGQFASCLSASLSSFFGATRILKAIADDDLFGRLLAPIKRSVILGNPMGSVVLSFLLVQLFMLIGSLDAIAPLSTTLFLLCYCSINLSCMVLDIASAPNFRPTFKCFHWSTCLVGLLACLSMMFVVSPLYSGVCIISFLVLLAVMHCRRFDIQWGHIGQALIFHQVRKYLLVLDDQKDHIKFWRPKVLLFVSSPVRSKNNILFINLLKKSGLFILSHVFLGDYCILPDTPSQELPAWKSHIRSLGVKAFPELTVASSLPEGIFQVTLLSGLGAMKPNIVAFGFPGEMGHNSGWRCVEEYLATIKMLINLKKDIFILRNFDQFSLPSEVCQINLWPLDFFGGTEGEFYDNKHVNFMLQMGCIFSMSRPVRSRATIKMFLPRLSSTDVAVEERNLGTLLKKLRIKAEICWIWEENYFAGHSGVARLISQEQGSAVVNMIQLPNLPPNETDYENYFGSLERLSRNIKCALFLHGNQCVTTTQF